MAGLRYLRGSNSPGCLGEHLADLAGHRHAVVGVDVDLAHAVLDAALDLLDRHAPGRLLAAVLGVDDVLQVLRHRGGAVHHEMVFGRRRWISSITFIARMAPSGLRENL
jgi:hypothetical protein